MSETTADEIVEDTAIDAYDEPDGITLVTTDIENLTEQTDGVLFESDEVLHVQVGETAGNPCYTDVDQFVALKTEYELDEQQAQLMAMQTGQEPDEIDREVEEASVFISNEDGEIGAGLIREKDGEVNDVIQQFVDSIEDGEVNIEFEETEELSVDG